MSHIPYDYASPNRRDLMRKLAEKKRAKQEATLRKGLRKLARGEPAVLRLFTARMSESEFWKIVDDMGWGKSYDYKAMQKKLLRSMTPEEIDEFHDMFEKLRGKVDRAVIEYRNEHDPGAYVSGDGFGDLTAHIIGLGKREYDAVMRDPSKGWKRYQDGDYRESFSYAVPSSFDVERMGIGKYQAWAKEMVKEYKDGLSRAKKLDDSMVPKVKRLIKLLEPMVEGNAMEFVEGEDEARRLAEEISETYREAVKSLMSRHQTPLWDGGDPYSNKWAVWNLFSDIHQYVL